LKLAIRCNFVVGDALVLQALIPAKGLHKVTAISKLITWLHKINSIQSRNR
jgi:hypothetical protein